MAEVGLGFNYWHLPPNESRGEGVLETVWVPLLDWQTSFEQHAAVQPEHLYAGQATTLLAMGRGSRYRRSVAPGAIHAAPAPHRAMAAQDAEQSAGTFAVILSDGPRSGGHSQYRRAGCQQPVGRALAQESGERRRDRRPLR